MNFYIFNFDYLHDLRSSLGSRKHRVVVLLLLFIVILLLAMQLLRTIFFFENFQVLAVRSLTNETKSIGIGSSRMFYGIDPRRMPGSYVSIAANYLDMTGAERIWSKFSKDIPAVQVVFIELSVSTLFYDMEVLSPQALQPLGLDVLPEPADIVLRPDHALRLLLSPVFLWRLTPDFLASYREVRQDVDEPMDEVPGFIPSKVRIAQPQLFAERKVAQTREHLEQFSSEVFVRNLNAAKRLAIDLQMRDIKTVFLRFPMESHVWPVFEKQWNEKVHAAFQEIKVEAKDAIFFDFSHNSEFLIEEFRDPDHLNEVGAQRFSGLVASILSTELYK